MAFVLRELKWVMAQKSEVPFSEETVKCVPTRQHIQAAQIGSRAEAQQASAGCAG